MKKQIGAIFLGLASVFTSQISTAAVIQQFAIGPAVDYSLQPHQPQVFMNSFIWTVKAKCTLYSKENDISLSFKVLRKSGSVNDVAMSDGDRLSLTFHHKDTVSISASSGAKVELLNNGTSIIVASCSTS